MAETKFECVLCGTEAGLHLVTIDAPDHPSGKDAVLKCWPCMSTAEMNACPYSISKELWNAVTVGGGDWCALPKEGKSVANPANFGLLYGKRKDSWLDELNKEMDAWANEGAEGEDWEGLAEMEGWEREGKRGNPKKGQTSA